MVTTHVPEPAAERRTVTLTPASSVKVRPVRWLLDNKIALGTLALLAGREGIGSRWSPILTPRRSQRGPCPASTWASRVR